MTRIWVLLLFFWLPGAVQADFFVACKDGCGDVPDLDRTVNLLVVEDAAESVTLEWTTGLTPDEDHRYLLVAGNPRERDKLLNLGLLDFTADGDVWSASRAFPVSQIGHETFIAVLLRQDGRSSEIADWRVFRVKRVSELEAELEDRPIQSGHSVDAELEFLQVSSGRGELPVSTGGNDKIWWPVPEQYSRQDIDIDGETTGVPGIGVLISPTWEAREDNWLQSLGNNLKELSGRFIEYNEFKVQESPPRTVDLGGQVGEVVINHFYSVITIHTNAGQTNFSAKDLGKRGKRVYFSHETSANLKQESDPRLWASYSEQEYSADPMLLQLVEESVEDRRSVPGLANIQQDDGDGGSVTYRVAFKARVRPWGEANANFKAGFVHVDVVAARHGIGGVDAQDPQAPTGFCKIIPCFGGSSKINLNDAPDSYRVAQPVASVATGEGALQLFTGPTLRAAKAGDEDEPAVDLPSTARFALTATMRSGALIRTKKEWFSRFPTEMVPVNSYAQFIIKYTVAMVPDEIIVVGDEQIAPDPDRLVETETATPEEEKGRFAELMDALRAFGMPWLIAIGAIALAIFVPGFLVFINAVFKLLTAIVRAITRLFGKSPPSNAG